VYSTSCIQLWDSSINNTRREYFRIRQISHRPRIETSSSTTDGSVGDTDGSVVSPGAGRAGDSAAASFICTSVCRMRAAGPWSNQRSTASRELGMDVGVVAV